jgi:hypothetical protein
VSQLVGVLELSVAPDRALTCCRAAFADLGWSVIREEPGALEAREDITRLCCHQSPAVTTLTIQATDAGSAVTVQTKVPGFGPVSSSYARGRQAAVARHVHDRATD